MVAFFIHFFRTVSDLPALKNNPYNKVKVNQSFFVLFFQCLQSISLMSVNFDNSGLTNDVQVLYALIYRQPELCILHYKTECSPALWSKLFVPSGQLPITFKSQSFCFTLPGTILHYTPVFGNALVTLLHPVYICVLVTVHNSDIIFMNLVTIGCAPKGLPWSKFKTVEIALCAVFKAL